MGEKIILAQLPNGERIWASEKRNSKYYCYHCDFCFGGTVFNGLGDDLDLVHIKEKHPEVWAFVLLLEDNVFMHLYSRLLSQEKK